MKRQKSNQAQVAAIIKKELKAEGIPCRATSDSFAGGDSVTVKVYDVPGKYVDEIEARYSKYQYGHFDGMNDIYEYSNNNNDIPQTKYLHIGCEYSDEIKQAALDWFFENHNPEGADQAPKKISDPEYHHARIWEEYLSTIVYRVLGDNLSYCADKKSFWDDYPGGNRPQKPSNKAPKKQATTPGAVTVEQHTHTQKGFVFYICVLAQNVDKNEFKTLLDQCREAGGWYSRKWGNTPGGFAFKNSEAAEQFAASIGGAETSDVQQDQEQRNSSPTLESSQDLPTSDPQQDLKKAEKLRNLADGLQTKIDHAFSDRLQNTAKRAAQAAHARLEGQRLERAQLALNRLADAHQAGTLPQVLQGITSKKRVLELLATKTEAVANGYHTYRIDTGEPVYSTEEAAALWDLISENEPKTNDREKEQELQRELNNAKFSQIPGYFSTPKPVLDQLLAHVSLFPGCKVLEPEAGSGAICDAVKENEPGAEITAFEFNYSLCKILDLKGYQVTRGDFLEDTETTGFDYVIQNPPFERQADIDHIRHAFSKLKPGGRLVSVCSPGPFFRDNRKSVDFREWIGALGGEKFDLPDGSFKESGTSINTVYVVIDKPHTH